MPRKKVEVDWDAARLAYVTDPAATFSSVGRQFGVDRKRVSERAAAEDWERQRDEQKAAVEKKVREEAAAELAESARSQMVDLLSDVSSVRRKMLADLREGGFVDVEDVEIVLEADECGAPVRRTRKSKRLDREIRIIETVLGTERGLLKDLLGLESGEGIGGPGFDPDDSFL